MTAINTFTNAFYALSPRHFFGGLQTSFRRKLFILALTGSGVV